VTPRLRVPAGAPDVEDLADPVARAELLRGLALGAAHSLNNAFTGVLGETLGLLDERKDDPVIVEACSAIRGEIERCARLTRALTTCIQPRRGLLEETDLAALVRALQPLVRETVTRAVAIEYAIPDAPVLVRGPAADLELLVLLLVQRVLAAAGSSGTLRLHVEPGRVQGALPTDSDGPRGGAGDAAPGVVLELAGTGAAPPHGEGAWAALVMRALDAVAARHGVAVELGVSAGTASARLRCEPVSPAA
jgi:hypothetical protein